MRTILPYLLLAILLNPPIAWSDSEKECPYESIGDSVFLAASLPSWNSLWGRIHAPDLGNRILEGFREDLLPAILEEAGLTAESASVENKIEELVEEVDWQALARTPILLLVWLDTEEVPMITLRADPPEGETGKVHEAVRNLLELSARWSGDLSVSQEADRAVLSATLDEEVFEWITLQPRGNQLWLMFGHSMGEALSGDGLRGRPGFREIWDRGPDTIDFSFVIDFQVLAGWVNRVLEEEPDAEVYSSLVLDETMEKLFVHDPETLEKLKKVQSDMDFLAELHSKKDQAATPKVLQALGDLGLLVSMSGPTQDGLENRTFWQVSSHSELSSVLASPPLSQRFRSLVTPEALSVQVYSLPDLGNIYRYLLELIESLPETGEILEAWKDLQDSAEFRLEKDLFPALGNEFGSLTRRSKTATFAGFRLVNNESFFLIETGEEEAVRNLLERVDRLLEGYQLQPNKTRIGDVTFSRLAAGLMGDIGWGWDRESKVLVVTTNPGSDYVEPLFESLRKPADSPFRDHPRWEELQALWCDEPTSIVYEDLSTTWKQQVEELQGAKMMLSIMGGGDPLGLGMISLAMELFTGIPAPDVYFRVDSEEENLKLSRSLLLFPKGESSTEP